MKSFVVLLLFVGMALVIHGIYEEKFKRLEKNVRVEYRFIPRTFYDEQLAQTDLMGKFKNMFEKDSPWYGDQYAALVDGTRQRDQYDGARKVLSRES
jgi:hypothetical protein